MGSIFLKTLIMFLLAFVISMVVAFIIHWTRRLLTSVRMNSLFDENAKILVRRAQRIHKIHDQSIRIISTGVEHEMHSGIFEFYQGIDENFEPVEDYNGTLKPIIRRKHSSKKHKIK